MSKIVCVVGLSGSGKTEATALLLSMARFHRIYFGGVVIAETEKRGLPLLPENEALVREELRRDHGMAVMAERCLPEIRTALHGGSNALVDGLYSYSEYRLLKREFGEGLILIAIHARKSLRAERLGRRPHRPLSFAEMEERDRREIEGLEKAPPICLADFHIVNDGSVSDLQRDLSGVLGEIKSELAA